MKRIAIFCAAVAMAGTATTLATSPAVAQAPQKVIETAAYDLSAPEGQDAVAAHIRRAATQVCGVVNQRDLAQKLQFQQCRQTAIEDGMAQLADLTRERSVTVVASR